jgi:hypothetical protein
MFNQYFFEAPIDENRTRIFFVNMRHFMLEPKNDDPIIKMNMEIAQGPWTATTSISGCCCAVSRSATPRAVRWRISASG